MTTATIRVSTKTRNTLRDLAKTTGLPMQRIVDEAIQNYQREHFLQMANAAYAQLRADEATWQAVVAERDEWDATLSDGLEAQS